MFNKKIAHRIIELNRKDVQLRNELIHLGQLDDRYHPKMEKLHIQNTMQLSTIVDNLGYPTIDKVGAEASQAAWLVIQHSISTPSFMKKCQILLQDAVQYNQANPINLAYLSDRIAVFEGRLQLYGTSFDWDKNNVLSPMPYDDLTLVNKRRSSLGLNTLEEQTQVIRRSAEEEGQKPPKHYIKRQQAYNEWRKKVDWI